MLTQDSLNFVPRLDAHLELGNVVVSLANHSTLGDNECIDIVTVRARRGVGNTLKESIYANAQVSDSRQLFHLHYCSANN